MSELRFKLAAGTHAGLVRQNNEDNFVVCPDLSTSEWIIPQTDDYIELGTYGALLVVADGMGGMNAGEVASALAVETIQELFTPERMEAVVGDSRSIQHFMAEVVKAADLKIQRRSQEDSGTRGMGTTVVMAWLLDHRAYVCWCGDSRAYVLNGRRGLMRLSRDHSYVQELVDSGQLEPEYAISHPMSNIITRCLGYEDKRAEAETRVYELYDGDIILLCSDGLCGLCEDELIADVISRHGGNLPECKNELIATALDHGGHDNVTVALAVVHTGEEAAEGDEGHQEDSNAPAFNINSTVKQFFPVDEPEEEEKEEPQESGDELVEASGVSAEHGDTQRSAEEASGELTDTATDGQQTEKEDDGQQAEEEDVGQQTETGDTQPTQDDSQPTPVKNTHTLRNIIIVLLLAVIAAACYFYFASDDDTLRQWVRKAYDALTQQWNTLIDNKEEKLKQ